MRFLLGRSPNHCCNQPITEYLTKKPWSWAKRLNMEAYCRCNPSHPRTGNGSKYSAPNMTGTLTKDFFTAPGKTSNIAKNKIPNSLMNAVSQINNTACDIRPFCIATKANNNKPSIKPLLWLFNALVKPSNSKSADMAAFTRLDTPCSL